MERERYAERESEREMQKEIQKERERSVMMYGNIGSVRDLSSSKSFINGILYHILNVMNVRKL